MKDRFADVNTSIKTEAILSILLGHDAPVDPDHLGTKLVETCVGEVEPSRRDQAWAVTHAFVLEQLPELARLRGPSSPETERAWCLRQLRRMGRATTLYPPIGAQYLIMSDLVMRLERAA